MSRIIIGDLHGDLAVLDEILAHAGLADGARWTGGERTLVLPQIVGHTIVRSASTGAGSGTS